MDNSFINFTMTIAFMGIILAFYFYNKYFYYVYFQNEKYK